MSVAVRLLAIAGSRAIFRPASALPVAHYASAKAVLPAFTDFEQFETHRRDGTATLLDVRQPDELVQIGSVPTAVNIPLGEVSEAFSLSPEKFRQRFGVDMPHPDSPIVTFCMKGVRAEKARNILSTKDFSNVSVYKGSYTDWADQMKNNNNRS